MSSNTTPLAVIGATGQQGGSVIEALLAANVPVRAIVRDAASPRALELSARGVDVVTADQENEDALAEALANVSSLFFMTTFDGSDGVEGEVRRGYTVAAAAARAGVPRVVYSSVGGAERATGIPHFESKFLVEERLRSLVPTQVIRPTFFMENLAAQLAPMGGEIVVRLPMPGDVAVQMVSVRDVGRASARALLEPGAVDGAIEIAGDEQTLDGVAAIVSEITGVSARFEQIPLEYLGDDEDLKAMFRWFAAGDAYRADIEKSRALVPGVLDIRAWLGTLGG